jgi:hypothetical protein
VTTTGYVFIQGVLPGRNLGLAGKLNITKVYFASAEKKRQKLLVLDPTDKGKLFKFKKPSFKRRSAVQ